MEEGTILNWKIKVGDVIEVGQPIVEIETDKVVLEVPAPRAGLLKEIIRETGASVSSEEVIARIDTDGTDNNTQGGRITFTGDLGGLGGVSAGDVLVYQLWYRDPTGPCSTGSNLSYALVATWH